ncbi:hypothetical protein [Vibrio aphrogenes]|uniref:hypothetical protein n=1 Tax=Vibrio aphrogenes TaxID=1891186 RepID=UPI000B36067B|nr:hypothetical protein [Vibrio aphrogenes]
MAVFLKKKRKSTLLLSPTEGRLFAVFTLILLLTLLWQISDGSHQNQAIKPLKQYQYLFNLACQQALNQGSERDSAYCVHAQSYNQMFTVSVKDQRIVASEILALETYFERYYRPFNEPSTITH